MAKFACVEKHFPLWWRLAAFLAFPILLGGCLGGRSQHYYGQAPVTDRGSEEEEEEWRLRYRRNRPVPPAEFRVPPVPARDNSFREFDDKAFRGMDAQPSLPDLPGDRPAGKPYPYLPPRLASDGATAGHATPSPARPTGVAPPIAISEPPIRSAGIAAEPYFYPVEQLVYGGGHPDFDRPESYRLMPRDVVTLAIKDHPELSGELEIQPDGTVHLPNTADLVRLRGLTADEAAAAVREAAAVYVKGDCAVRIQTNRARGGYYFVFGEVLQPGRFPMGLEPVRLSDAILAANWEANPARRDLDGDELGPSFPAAAPRGRYVSPAMADLARVMLITPHRSQPARTTHDMRSALLGVTGDDPIVRPGQIIVVPSLDPDRNAALGGILPSTPTAPPRAAGFSGAGSSSRLPPPAPERTVETGSSPLSGTTEAEDNMSAAFTIANETAPPSDQVAWPGNYLPPGAKASRRRSGPRREEGTGGWKMGF